MAAIFLLKRRYINRPGRLTNEDFKLIEVLEDRGHTVAYSEADSTTPDQVFQPLIFCTGDNVQAAWADDPRPMLVTSANSAQVLGMTNNSGIDASLNEDDAFNSPSDPNHPIVQGYSSGLDIQGDHIAFASGYGDGQVILSSDRGATLITWNPGDSRLDGSSFPAKRLFGFWSELWWNDFNYPAGYEVYNDALKDVLMNAIAWLEADSVPVEFEVTAAATDLLSQLDRGGYGWMKPIVETLASELGTENLDQIMLQVLRAMTDTERFQNRSRLRTQRLNYYRWTISEQGRFSGYLRLPQSIWQRS
ncbi:MAG: hypothetical protein AAGH78_17400 [Cyanobacteria bacterium P01_H01_bin.58]